MKSYLPLPVSMKCCICNYYFHYSSMRCVERCHVKTKAIGLDLIQLGRLL